MPEEAVDRETGEVEERKEKTPYTFYGFKDATTRTHIIDRWWTDRPNALVGIPTGERSGFWVLDVDVPPKHEDGRPWLAAMEEKHGPLETRKAETATGGLHFLFRHKEGVRNADVATGVETRGEGGYYIAPGSVMADGSAYRWLNDDDIAEAPQWLLDIVVPARQPAQHVPATYTRDGPQEDATFAEIEEMLTYVSPDCGYQDWVNVLMAIHSALGADGLALADSWSSRGQKYRKGEVARKWKGFTSGGGVGIGSLAELARQGGANLSSISRAHRGYQDVQPMDVTAMIRKAEERRLATPRSAVATPPPAAPPPAPPSAAAPEAPPTTSRILTATPFVYRDPSLIPRREFLFGRHYVRKYLTATFGAGGGGKSANAVTETLAMATGRPLLGGGLQEPLRVWYINAEDDPVEIERRFAAAIKHFRIKPHQVEGNLFADSGRIQEFVIMKEDGKRTRVCEPIVAAFKDEVRRNRIDVAIVDPFVSTHEVEENDNSKIQRVANQWVLIAEEAGCAIELIHHVTKNNMEITADSGRGAGALKDKCRSVRTINQMSEGEATEAAIRPEERLGYFRVDFGKANLAKRSGKSEWRKFESVKLGNGRGNLAAINGDEIGVVTPWEWPSSEKVAEGLTEEQFIKLRVALDNGAYKAAPNAKEWAGLAVAYAMGLDADDKGSRRQAGSILKALMKEGKVVSVPDTDPITRHVSVYIRSAEYNLRAA